MSTSRTQAGVSLATTLVFAGLALMLGLALASSSVSHLHFSNTQSQAFKATSAAEATLALAIDKVVTNRDFGRSGGAQAKVEFESPTGKGRLTFDPALAEEWGVPASTNNNSGTSAVDGWQGRPVPAEAVHLVAVGEAGGTRKTVEAIVEVPKFPYAVASSGPIESSGDLIVGGVSEVEDALSGLEASQLDPADLASNASGEAVKLMGKATVSGNVRAVGEIQLGDEVVLEGEVQAHSAPVPLNELDINELKPSYSTPFVGGYAPVVRHSKHSNEPSLTIRGGLTLDDGIFFVNGDLVVHGGIRGVGALLVNGSVEIEGGAELAAANQVAVVAKGDVVIHGSERGSSFFQGLIYTEGDLMAQDVTLLGAFVANREQSTIDPGSRLVLENASVVRLQEYSNMHIEIPGEVTYSLSTYQDPGERGLAQISGTPEQMAKLAQALSADWKGNPGPGAYEKLTEALQAVNISGYSADPTNPGPLGGLVHELTYASTPSMNPVGPGAGGTGGGASVPPVVFDFDMNEYLSELSRNRIIYWQEH